MRALLLMLCLAAPWSGSGWAGAAWAQGVPAIAPPRAAEPSPGPVAASPNPLPAGTPAIAPTVPAPAAGAVPAVAGAPGSVAEEPRRRRRVVRRAPSRSQDPRDRAYMDGGLVPQSGFSGFETRVAPPRAELAPRPNLDLEGPRAQPRSNSPSLEPTLINPRLPGRSAVQDSGVTQRENRLLQSPAPGARLSVPMSW